jgi:uncharacterized damage-inducible protein DinB
MFLRVKGLVFAFVLVVAGTSAVVAQDKSATAPTVGGFQAETIGQMNSAAKKLIALAEAMPENTLLWRPSDKVRSSSEVFMHIAQANYFILGIAGAEVPTDLPKGMEKITGKAEIVAHLKRSFEHSNAAIKKMSDDDLAKSVKLFGNDSTKRGVLLLLSVHAHEHLGQVIAYARMNNLTPPWARPAS